MASTAVIGQFYKLGTGCKLRTARAGPVPGHRSQRWEFPGQGQGQGERKLGSSGAGPCFKKGANAVNAASQRTCVATIVNARCVVASLDIESMRMLAEEPRAHWPWGIKVTGGKEQNGRNRTETGGKSTEYRYVFL
ncbi:hypothetical protein VTK56DRAFT_6949 [Thermocarpiscus australiensis]